MLPDKPMAAVAVAFGAGILAAAHLSPGAFLLVTAGIALVLALAKLVPSGAARFIVIAAFALGAARYSVSREIPADDISRFCGRAAALNGRVVSDPETRPDRVRLVVRVDRVKTGSQWIKAGGKVSVNIYEPAASGIKLDYGDRLTAWGCVYRPAAPTNPGQFSWSEYLARQGIYSCLSIRNVSQVRRSARKGGFLPIRAAIAAKHYAVESIARTHSSQQAGLVSGMLFGTYSYLPPETIEDFTRTGTLHILAASGFNCYVVAAFSSLALMGLRVMPRPRSAITVILLLVYLAMVGPKPSLVRATVMASFVLLGRLLRRVPNLDNIFFVAALFVLMLNPSDLFDVGFQLSFAGVWALLKVAPLFDRLLREAGLLGNPFKTRSPMLHPALKKIYAGFWSIAGSTAAVSLVTAPLVAHYFNYVSTVSMPANAVVGGAVPFLFVVGVLAVFFGWVPGLGHLLGMAGSLLSGAMLSAVRFLAEPEWSSIAVASPPPLAIAGYYIILAGFYGWMRQRYAG